MPTGGYASLDYLEYLEERWYPVTCFNTTVIFNGLPENLVGGESARNPKANGSLEIGQGKGHGGMLDIARCGGVYSGPWQRRISTAALLSSAPYSIGHS